MEPKEWLTVKQTAELLGMSERSVYEAVERGSLRAIVRRGYSKGYRINRQEVDRWMKEEWVAVAAR